MIIVHVDQEKNIKNVVESSEKKMNEFEIKVHTGYENNLFFKEMARKFTTSNNKGFLFQMNYYDSKVPLELTVRNEGLISSVNPPTNDVMYNTFTKFNYSVVGALKKAEIIPVESAR